MHPDPYYPLARPTEGVGQDDDCSQRSFAHGVYHAFLIFWVAVAILAMIWLFADDAFAAPADRPALCAQYRGGEVAACIAEMGQ